jgi:hypothetical protein
MLKCDLDHILQNKSWDAAQTAPTATSESCFLQLGGVESYVSRAPTPSYRQSKRYSGILDVDSHVKVKTPSVRLRWVAVLSIFC